jgi:hypothetical protein
MLERINPELWFRRRQHRRRALLHALRVLGLPLPIRL